MLKYLFQVFPCSSLELFKIKKLAILPSSAFTLFQHYIFIFDAFVIILSAFLSSSYHYIPSFHFSLFCRCSGEHEFSPHCYLSVTYFNCSSTLFLADSNESGKSSTIFPPRMSGFSRGSPSKCCFEFSIATKSSNPFSVFLR